jgi:hypothetical protein
MISINGGCYLWVEMEGLEQFNKKMFKSLIITESIGLINPIFELRLLQANYSLYPYLFESNKHIKITYGTEPSNSLTRVFTISNYNYTGSGEGMELILTGQLELKDFINKPTIRSFKKKKLSEVLKEIKTIGLDIQYDSDDLQTYIQFNVSDKRFIMKSLMHSCTEESKDLVLGAISVEKELIVSSVKTIYKKDYVKVFHQVKYENDPKVVKFDSLKPESDSALWSDQLAEGKSLPVFHVEDRSIEKFSSDMKSLINGNDNSMYSNNMNYPIIMDNGNCHKRYYESFMNNINYFVALMKNNVFLNTTSRYLSNNDLKLLDLVKLIPNDKSKNDALDPLSGKYILTQKITRLDVDAGFSHRFRLNRDFSMRY